MATANAPSTPICAQSKAAMTNLSNGTVCFSCIHVIFSSANHRAATALGSVTWI